MPLNDQTPVQIIADYMLRFMRNNKEAKLYEAKERLEKKIRLFVADGWEEKILRQSFAGAQSCRSRAAFVAEFETQQKQARRLPSE